MKKLIIVRHAHSPSAAPGISDHDRPLSEKGMNDAARIGGKLAAKGFQVDKVMCSSALRTTTTAGILAKALSVKEWVTERMLYNTGVAEYAEVIRYVEDAVDVLILVGHNPTVSEFPASFGEHLTPASAVIWEWEGRNWASFTPEKTRLAEIIIP